MAAQYFMLAARKGSVEAQRGSFRLRHQLTLLEKRVVDDLNKLHRT